MSENKDADLKQGNEVIRIKDEMYMNVNDINLASIENIDGGYGIHILVIALENEVIALKKKIAVLESKAQQ